MVVHQHVAVHGDAVQRRRLAQRAEVAAPVLVVEEHRLPVVAALDDVMGETGDGKARQSGHVQASSAETRNGKVGGIRRADRVDPA